MTNNFIEKMAVLYEKVPSSLFMSIRLAQAIIESGWGQSDLARLANNFAGIKADKHWAGDVYEKYSNEDYNGKMVSELSTFRKYKTIEEFVVDHSNFITSSEWRKNYYKSVIQAKSYQEQAQALTGTYATDRTYGQKLINTIEQYKLYEYDKERENMGKHLVICGHGMPPVGKYDPGADGPMGTEAHWVRQLASRMSAYNNSDIHYITDKNVFEYRNIHQYTGYDTITELHLNAFGNKEAKGCEVLIWHEFEADELDNKLLAILAQYFVNRGIKTRGDLYNASVSAQSGFNYRLVECCFVSNIGDMEIFSKHIDDIARQFVEAITGKVIAIKEAPKKERGGKRTADTYPKVYKPLNNGQTVEVRQQATHYQNNQEIHPSVNGQTYTVDGVMDARQSHSNRAYRLTKNGVAIGWVLEQDIIEAWEPVKEAVKDDKKFSLNGKRYKIVEDND